MSCFAQLSPNQPPSPVPHGLGATDLQQAYNIPADNSGAIKTVAVVTAFDTLTAQADLALYRAAYGLPVCTTDSGCFRKVDQTGGSSTPVPDPRWAQETSLDLDMVSASCPTCRILLVEASSDYLTDLAPAVNTAVRLGADAVSNSYGTAETPGLSQFDSFYSHPGVPVTVSAGDNGYGVSFPASSPEVIAVGGTSLRRAPSTLRGWAESAWGTSFPGQGTGSGCSRYTVKPAWQTDKGCLTRSTSDVSAVADPATGVAVFSTDGGGWIVMGGTSVAAPLIAGMYALAGKSGTTTNPASYPYSVPSALHDVTSGLNGSCAPLTYLCTAGPGYDGPTGVGTPNGVAGFTDLTSEFTAAASTAGFGQPQSPIDYTPDGSCHQTYSDGTVSWRYPEGATSIRTTIKTQSAAAPPGIVSGSETPTMTRPTRLNTPSNSPPSPNVPGPVALPPADPVTIPSADTTTRVDPLGPTQLSAPRVPESTPPTPPAGTPAPSSTLNNTPRPGAIPAAAGQTPQPMIPALGIIAVLAVIIVVLLT